jgi:hypothetical protein
MTYSWLARANNSNGFTDGDRSDTAFWGFATSLTNKDFDHPIVITAIP